MELSVITVNFNNAEGLRRTIESVVTQTHLPIDYIIIDGGSTDSSLEEIDRYKDSINYVVSEPDRGIYDAMNKGIKVASGDYLLFLNSGDYLISPDSLSSFMAQGVGADIILGSVVGSDGKEIKLWYSLDFCNVWRYGAHHQAMLIKRSLFEEIGMYNDSGDITSDWQFLMLSLFKYKKTVKYIDSPLSVYDLRGISSQKHRQRAMNGERKKFLRKNFPERSFLQIEAINRMRFFSRKLNSLYAKATGKKNA
jgi:glycosyltransferase involved in cell wall biosynthesis